MGPSAIRYAGIAERLRAIGYAVDDRGDIPSLAPRRPPRAIPTPSTSRRSSPLPVRSRPPSSPPNARRPRPRARRRPLARPRGVRRSRARAWPGRRDLARCARRLQHARDEPHRQRPRHAARSRARLGRLGIRGRRRPCPALGRQGAQHHHRRARPRRARASAPSYVTGRRPDDDQDRPASNGARRTRRDRARAGCAFRARSTRPRCRRSAIGTGVGTPVRGGISFREAHLAVELLSEAGVADRCRSSRSTPSWIGRTPRASSRWSLRARRWGSGSCRRRVAEGGALAAAAAVDVLVVQVCVVAGAEQDEVLELGGAAVFDGDQVVGFELAGGGAAGVLAVPRAAVQRALLGVGGAAADARVHEVASVAA